VRAKRTRKAPRAKRTAKPIRSRKPAVPAERADFAWITSSTAIVAVMAVVVFTAALLTAREDVPRADVNAAGHENMAAAAPIATPTIAPPTVPQPAEAPKAAPKTATANAAVPPAPQAPAIPVTQATAMPVSSTAIEPNREKPASVTISGCLENEGGTFLLTDASGTAAPKSRSWKSGFLRKRTAQIELADGLGTLTLRNHVGRRVAATGTLVDREMRVDSVRALGACE
jgi:hypothetical protein